MFHISGADASSLTALDFLNSPNYEFGFVVRFRGFDDNGSDKVPALVIPLPAPVALGAIGLFGVMFGSRRVRRTSEGG